MKINIKRFYSFFELLFVLSLILNINTIWAYMEPYSSWFNKFIIALLIISVIGCLLFSSSNKYTFVAILMLSIGLFCYFLLYYFCTENELSDVLAVSVSVLMISIYTLTSSNLVNVFIKYEKIMVVVAAISIFIWLFGSTLNILPGVSSSYTTWTGTGDKQWIKVWYNIQTEAQYIWVGPLLLVRNTAIFVEAPFAAFSFSIALFIELFLNSSRNRYIIILFVLTIISTISTTGFLSIIFAYILYKYSKVNKMSASMYIGIIILILFSIVISGVLVSNKLADSLGSVRLNDYIVGFRTWIDYPIFGV